MAWGIEIDLKITLDKPGFVMKRKQGRRDSWWVIWNLN